MNRFYSICPSHGKDIKGFCPFVRIELVQFVDDVLIVFTIKVFSDTTDSNLRPIVSGIPGRGFLEK